jgi:ribosomal protein S18 acetylase RimI-like enzyme
MIKKLNQAEIRTLPELYLKTWQVVYQTIVSEAFYDYLTLDQAKLDIEEAIFSGEVFFGKHVDDELVGFVSVRQNSVDLGDYAWELHRLYVATAFQGQGIGRKLFETARDFLIAEQGVYRFFLFVVAQNRAKAFYQKLGGQMILERQISEEIPDIELAMAFDFGKGKR